MTATGSLRMARNNARAGPVGSRRDLFQLRSVETSIESSSANFNWLGYVARMARTSIAASPRGRATPPTARAGRI